jgi:hypothetical protein
MPEKPAEAADDGPVRGETPEGDDGVVMLGRQIAGPGAPALQLTILLPRPLYRVRCKSDLESAVSLVQQKARRSAGLSRCEGALCGSPEGPRLCTVKTSLTTASASCRDDNTPPPCRP